MSPEGTPPSPNRNPLYNWISLVGVGIAAVAGAAGTVLLARDMLADQHNPYTGVVILAVGGVVALGLGIIAAGAIWTWRRQRLPETPTEFWLLTLDFGKPRDRLVGVAIMVGGILLVSGASLGGYHGTHYASTNDFCSNGCHDVMGPEGIAYQLSPHARVDCVECHVGDGAAPYIAAKVNGLRQVYGVLTGDYAKPIPTPLHNMRPSDETCEQCHWRGRWIGYKEKVYTYFGGDETNTKRHLRLLVNVGGGHAGTGGGEGIHYHMLLNRKVEYIARDHERQKIAWLRVTEPDGTTKEFNDRSKPLSDEDRRTLTTHVMECMDCHNRPAHRFPAPMDVMNELLAADKVSPKIPFIKKKGVEVMAADYATQAEGLGKIAEQLKAFYDDEHAEFAKANAKLIDDATREIQAAFQRTVFPEMKARWSSHPDNIGHRDFPGCFRCHADSLVDKDGKEIFTTCNGCHVVIGQGEDANTINVNVAEGQEYYHAGDDSNLTTYTDCVSCHTGGPDIY